MAKKYLFSIIVTLATFTAFSQAGNSTYWNTNLNILPYRLPPPPLHYKPVYIDIDHDGDPDVIKSISTNNTPVCWIDDDDDMKAGDIEGDTDSDCLLIDRNKDGRYGALGDLVIDWVDNDRDNKADMQVVVEYPPVEKESVWPNGHYMWVLDTDKDNIFNYIDWNTFQLKAWEKTGTSDFIEDYSGQSTFLKVHAATNRMESLKLNWENPFLFYDEDKDALSEMAVRLGNTPSYYKDSTKSAYQQTLRFSGNIDWVSIAVDLDNDNAPGNEFDFDFSLGFRGEGFNYLNQVHKFQHMHGLAGTDTFFLDARWRHMDELVYADHKAALDLVFNKGKWNKVFFVYDEDDDCNRWERVEFYDPYDPFKVGTNKGGIDNHPQADVAGDRGEWDLDNSGKGKLYVSRFDGRLHLFGAEWGAWRIDQTATYFQGWDRSWTNRQPQKFATVKYEDKDTNGFIDQISYDLDGDTTFENIVDLKQLQIDDRCNLVDVSKFTYNDYITLQKTISANMWKQSQIALQVATKFGLNTSWYAKLFNASSIEKKYQNGYWIQLYIYNDLNNLFLRQGNKAMSQRLTKGYYSSNWQSLLK